MGLGRFGRHHDFGAILSSLQGYGLADAPTGTRNENSLSCQFSGKERIKDRIMQGFS